VGAPARVIRTLDAERAEGLVKNATGYVGNAIRFAKGLRKIA
jgi:carbonic anhydrase/acetyltransferase-like protein (isoleucine patch superfamily)